MIYEYHIHLKYWETQILTKLVLNTYILLPAMSGVF